MVKEELLVHGIFSSISGLSVVLTGFGCDSMREFSSVLSATSDAFRPSSPINMALSGALVTAVQVVLRRRMINGSLLLNVLPVTFIGVVLSLNTSPAVLQSFLIPGFGACLLGLSLAVLWMEMTECRRRKGSVRDSDEDGRQITISAISWKWTGVLATTSLAAGLMSGSCPPPGPAFMAVLLAQGRGMVLVGAGGGGEWRTTAALVTSSASILRVGLLLLENGASVGPMSEVAALVTGGLVGLVGGNLCLLCSFPSRSDQDVQQRRSPSPTVLKWLVLALALASSIPMTMAGAPAVMATVVRPVALVFLVLVIAVAISGLVWGWRRSGAENDTARGAYGEVPKDDADIELTPFTAGSGPDGLSDDEEEDGYLDEEDGYLADEGETEFTRRSRRTNGRGGIIAGSKSSHSMPSRHSRAPGDRGSRGGAKEKERSQGRGVTPDSGVRAGVRAPVAAATSGGETNQEKTDNPEDQPQFPAGHTVEL